MIRTRVGYAGGTKQDPTYYSLGDHTETVQLDFDPNVVSYEELLALFFAAHDSSYPAASRQYMSAVFFEDAEQERLARAAKAEEEARTGKVSVTEILPSGTFYLAEDYHQKYGLRGDGGLLAELTRMYPDIVDLVDSTAATRINAYLYGHGTLEQVERELSGFGLSEAGEQRLRSLFE